MGNPLPHSPAAPALDWAEFPEIPEPWELLESPQIWVNGEYIPGNLIYNTTPGCDLQATFSPANSPSLGQENSFNTFSNIDISLHSLIPTTESNDQNSSATTLSQEQLATRNGFGSLDTIYHHASSPSSHIGKYLETTTSDHVQVPRSTQAKTQTQRDRSHRHSPTGSDTPSSQDSDEERLAEKRRRNKLAARKLRQKKLDQVSELEAQLEKVKKERDDLRLRAAKSEGELMALRQMIDQKGAI